MTPTEHTYTHSTTWQSPSNLAIVKYWGKKEVQVPLNPSVSFTLSKAVTTTSVGIYPKRGGGASFRLDGIEQPSFLPKINTFLQLTSPFLPYLNDFFLDIQSHNSFPHSSGIASSASSMSALALCLCELEAQLTNSHPINLRLASTLARLGSGSAARSVYGGWNLWGRMAEFSESSDDFAIPLPVTPAPVFRNLHDDIVIISSKTKSVSSSEGHRLMNNHPYKTGRLLQAQSNTLELTDHLKNGDVEAFINLAENEALSLHALMMSSSPGYTLLHPNTLEVIHRVRSWRRESSIPVGFSLDAGPNLHILYPDAYASSVKDWMAEAIVPLCENQTVIRDRVGDGPQKINEVRSN